jgi:predicted CoA-binding protein
MNYSDSLLREVLTRTRVVAIVGVSTNPVRASYFVARYLGRRGKREIPVNPAYPGERLFGELVRPDLAAIPEADRVDFVDIFRRPEAVPEIVEAALAHLPGLRTIWMQLGITHPEAAARAEAAGITVIQDRCPKIEYQRLFGELRQGGFNTGILSSRL